MVATPTNNVFELAQQPVQYQYHNEHPHHPQYQVPHTVIARARLVPIVSIAPFIVPSFLVVVIGKVGFRVRVHLEHCTEHSVPPFRFL